VVAPNWWPFSHPPGVVQIPLVPQQQTGVVGGQLQLGQLTQDLLGLVEAVSVADRVDDDEGLTPSDVLVQTAVLLQHNKTFTFLDVSDPTFVWTTTPKAEEGSERGSEFSKFNWRYLTPPGLSPR
jgi:hypothetical protein